MMQVREFQKVKEFYYLTAARVRSPAVQKEIQNKLKINFTLSPPEVWQSHWRNQTAYCNPLRFSWYHPPPHHLFWQLQQMEQTKSQHPNKFFFTNSVDSTAIKSNNLQLDIECG